MIELRTLGCLDLRRGDENLDRVLAQPKRAALLIYLAVTSPGGFHSRDVLLSLLWPESNQRRARASLRKALHFLRTHLGSTVFLVRGDELAVDREQLWCDVRAFVEAVESDDPRSALEAYRGELLPGFFVSHAPDFERWLEAERRRLRRDAVRMAWSLSRSEEDAGNGPGAARFGRRGLAIDPLDEMSIRRLVLLLDRLGDRAGALRVYESAVERLRRELDLEPSEETRALGERICRKAPTPQADPTPSRPRPDPEPSTAVQSPIGVSPVLGALPGLPAGVPGGSGRGDSSRLRLGAGRKALIVGIGSFALSVCGAAIGGWLLLGADGLDDSPLAAPPGVSAPEAAGSGNQSLVDADGFPRVVSRGGEAPGSVEHSVAVLPFESLSTYPEQRHLADGVADEILSTLTRIPGLAVAARTSSFAFRESDLDLRVIADSLGVATVLEGSVRRDADRIRVSATLVDAGTGFRIWSETFEGEVSDVFDIQDRIARSVARGLRPEVTNVDVPRVGGTGTTNADSHDRYLRGRQLAFQRTRAGVLGAIRAFEDALDVDPRYAAAYAALANTYTLARVYSFVPPDSAYRWAGREIAYGDRAVTLDPFNGEAHASLGWLTWNLGGPLDQAERHLRRGLELQPSLAPALGWYGMLLSLRGRHSEALEAHQRAVELDPISPGVRIGYAASALWAGEPELTLRQVRRAREIQPGLGGLASAYEVWALLLLGRAEECLNTDLRALPAYEATCLHQMGRTAEAEAMIRRAAQDWSPSSSTLDTNGLVIYHAWAGRPDEALEWVRRGLSASPYVPTSSPVFMFPGGLWDPVLEGGGADLRRSVEHLREEAWKRVLEESRRVELNFDTQ